MWDKVYILVKQLVILVYMFHVENRILAFHVDHSTGFAILWVGVEDWANSFLSHNNVDCFSGLNYCLVLVEVEQDQDNAPILSFVIICQS
jgi:hypothetical protein